MAIWDTFQLIQLFNLSRLNNNHRYFLKRIRFLTRLLPHTIALPSFVPPPKSLSITDKLKGTELNYPGCSSKNGVILYIHGGGFIWSTFEYGYPMLYKLMAKTGCIAIAIDYRISPENTIIDAVEDCINAYKYIVDNYDNDNIFIIGDSAGGCLSMLTLQALNKNGLQQPKGGIILSAVCDLSLSHDSIEGNKYTDPVLQVSGLRAGYQMGLGNLDMNGKDTGNNMDSKNPLYSPLYGSFKGVCSLYFISGVHEIFYDENVAAMNKAKEDGVDVEYEWNEWLIHTTVIFSAYEIDEANDSLARIADWINNCILSQQI